MTDPGLGASVLRKPGNINSSIACAMLGDMSAEPASNQMKTQAKKTFKFLAALVSIAVAISAQATTIPLTNPSFESPVAGAWSSGFLPDGWSWDFGSYIQSPSAHDGNQGVIQNGSANAFFRLSQNSTYTVVRTNETITGKVWVRVTNLERGKCNFRIELLIDGTGVMTNTFTVTTGMVTGQEYAWAQISVQYSTVAADIGKSVGVAIGNDGGDNSAGYSPSYCYMDEVSLDTVSVGGPTVVGSATPNPTDLFSNVLFSVTVTPGGNPVITNVVLDASPLGGSSTLQLVSAGGNVYTNTVAATAPISLDTTLQLPATVTDASGLVGQVNIPLVVNRPSVLTWGGGVGNWNDINWQPFGLSGPIAGPNRTAVVTNGQVFVNQPGGIGGAVAIILASGGIMQVDNGHYGAYGNITFAGGTLDTYDNSSYHAYGASILSGATVVSGPSSTLANTGGSWFNLSDPATTITVSNGATLNVSAQLAGAVAANDNFYNPSGLTKAGAGTLILSGTNTYAGTTTVSAGLLSLASTGAVQSNTVLAVSSGAVVNLNYSGNIELSSLVLNGVPQASGTHGATGSGAAHINNTYFTGTGTVSVPGPLLLNYVNLGGGQLQFSWTGSATLQVQTNSLSTGLGTTWSDYSGTSPVTVNVDAANGSVFFRLKQ